jgi:hypothetical protein
VPFPHRSIQGSGDKAPCSIGHSCDNGAMSTPPLAQKDQGEGSSVAAIIAYVKGIPLPIIRAEMTGPASSSTPRLPPSANGKLSAGSAWTLLTVTTNIS